MYPRRKFFNAFCFSTLVLLLGLLSNCASPPSPAPTLTVSASVKPSPAFTSTPITPSGGVYIEGKRYFLFGANYPWYNYGRDFGDNAWGHYGVSTQYNVIESDFAKLSEMGIQVVRWFVFADGAAAPDFAANGSVTGLDDKVFIDLDTSLKIAQAHKIRLILVLLDFKWLAQPKEVNGVTVGGHADVILDPVKRKTLYQQALIPLLERYGQNPYILAWEVMNEPEWAIDNPDIKSNEPIVRVPHNTMQDFVRETVEIIHKNSRQLVTLGSASRRWWGLWEGVGLDICQFHYYDWMETDTPLDFPYTSLKTKLPCIVGEFPAEGSALTLDKYYQTILSNGYAGTFPWSLRAEIGGILGSASIIKAWHKRFPEHIIPTPIWTPTPSITRTPSPSPSPTITPDPSRQPDTSQYGFEAKDGEWTHQTFTGNQAVMSVRRVYKPAPYLGQYALQLDVNLISGDEHLKQGEALVNVIQHPPRDGSVGPYDLENRAITCWVFLPVGAHGDTKAPWIGFQVFAKDTESNSFYGAWEAIQLYDVGKWVRISLLPQRYMSPTPTGGYFIAERFNPKAIATIGVKIGTSSYYAASGVSYKGPVYIDACDWK